MITRKRIGVLLGIFGVISIMAIVSVIGVLSLLNAEVNFGGSISFIAGKGVNATISKADVTDGALMDTSLMPEVKINSESDGSAELEKWKNINLNFPTGVNQVTISFKVTNHNQLNMLAVDIGGVAGTYNNATMAVEMVHVGKGITSSVVSSAHVQDGEVIPTEYYKEIIITFSKTNLSKEASVSNFNIPINLTNAEPNLPDDWLTLSADKTYYTITKGSSTLPANLLIPEIYNDKPVKEIYSATGPASSVFYSQRATLTSVILPRTIVIVGDNAFYSCSKLSNADLSNSVNLITIGESVFDSCRALTNITLPNSLTTIESSAFSSCWALTNITLPNSLTTIESSAFSSCWALTNITIPKNVNTIGVNPFDFCSKLSRIIVDSANTNFKVVDEALYDINVSKLISWPKGSATTSPTLPSTLITIGENAFQSCDTLTNITLPNSLITIGSYAFSSCANLTNVDFSNCTNLITIGRSAFNSCANLTNVDFSNCTNLTTIESSAFSSCSSLTDITLPNSLTTIESSAFLSCSSLTDITIPKNVNTIGYNPFLVCNKLSKIIVDSANTNFKIVDEALYDIGVTRLISWPAGSATTSLTLPSTIESIGDNAFFKCKNLISINLSNCIKLTTIESGAFRYCTMDLDFSDCTSLTTIDIHSFDYYEAKEIIFPSSLTKITGYVYGISIDVDKVVFNDPNGWKVNGNSMDLSDPVQNAIYLKEYTKYTWTKS